MPTGKVSNNFNTLLKEAEHKRELASRERRYAEASNEFRNRLDQIGGRYLQDTKAALAQYLEAIGDD